MSTLFNDVDAWIHAVVLGLLMSGAWWIGCWRGRRTEQIEKNDATGQLTGASVALLGLLLAFTFSMSLERHEQRRRMVVEHSNTIGDFATCVSLQNEPVRGRLRELVRKYVEHLLAIRKADITEEELSRALTENERLHNDMQALVKVAVDNGTPIAVSLVNTFNDLTSSHDARLAAIRNRLPPSIVILLALSAVISMIQIGMQHGELSDREVVNGVGFILLVSLCVWVSLDLNQPQGGMITISQEPMQRLLKSLSQ